MIHRTAFIKALCIALSSCGGIGYLPAPGTCATLLIGIPLAYLINSYVPSLCVAMGVTHTVSIQSCLWVVIVACTALGSVIVTQSIDPKVDADDPQWIVIDEVIGICYAYAGQPLSIKSITAAFILFRFFDISKCGPVAWGERLPGAAGIIADDIIAGICTRLLLMLL